MKTNPYASPRSNATSISSSPSPMCPELPLVCRVSSLTMAVMVPTGLVLTIVSGLAMVVAVMMGADRNESAVFAIAMAVVCGIVGYGCLICLRCRVVVSNSSIEIISHSRHAIHFSQIVSWRHHPMTGAVILKRRDSTNDLPVSNWAMSRQKSKQLGAILSRHVGPAGVNLDMHSKDSNL